MGKQHLNFSTKGVLPTYLILATWNLALFALVYGLTNWLNSLRKVHFFFYFEWELNIPFIPQFVFIYLSLILLAVLPVFVLEKKKIQALSHLITIVTLIAGVFFIFLPTKVGFGRQESDSIYNWIFSLVYTFDLPYNLVPSLHVSYTYAFFFALWDDLTLKFRMTMLIWVLLISSSVLFVHQHHILDLIAGFLLASVSTKFGYCKFLKTK